MTVATVGVANKGRTLIVRADGHAERPDVCAAISALLFAFDGVALNNHSPGDRTYKSEHGPGYYHVTAKRCGNNAGAFDMLRTGLLMLEKTYPDNLKVIDET